VGIRIAFVVLAIVFTSSGITSCKNSIKTTYRKSEILNLLSDDSLLTLVQHSTFQYFWEGAEPFSGLARERYHVDGVYPENDQNIITSGGSGFGVMAILVGINRRFITRDEGYLRLQKIVSFLEKADRFHGAWPHWIYGETGKVKPFSLKDNGADIVETAYLMQGLLAVRQYFSVGSEREKVLANRIDKLWKGVEWNWFTKGGEKVMYWHWSPEYSWDMNLPVQGYNECLIVYILAASSPTFPIDPKAYFEGWARSGKIVSGKKMYDIPLILKYNFAEEYGGPLFWAHYSYLGLDPNGLSDKYADYWQLNVNQTLINHKWCTVNPEHFLGYSENRWGLTASYSISGYAAHAPGEKTDLGVISPTAALSSFPYTPAESMAALKDFYFNLGNKLYGKYGFYDAFSEQSDWYPKRYLAIDQGPEVIMIENFRSGLLWHLFMSCPEIQIGLKKLGFKTSVSVNK
jgi:hypothetical protein